MTRVDNRVDFLLLSSGPLHFQAEWLRADLTAWRQSLEKTPRQARMVEQTLRQHAQKLLQELKIKTSAGSAKK